MKIIGHRGARNLAPENSLESIRAAVRAGVDAVEFDIRLSKDGQFFLSHDPTLLRVSGVNVSVRHSTSRELKRQRLPNGEALPTLVEALETRHGTTAIIEAKGTRWAQHLADFLTRHQPKDISVISFNHNELVHFHRLMPEIACYPIERTKVFEVLQLAQKHHMTGVDLKFWLLNPFTYWYARHYRLELIVYTVNSRLIAWYFGTFFPQISVTTDMPDKIRHRGHR